MPTNTIIDTTVSKSVQHGIKQWWANFFRSGQKRKIF